MRRTPGERSSDIEDRRDQSAGGFRVGGLESGRVSECNTFRRQAGSA